MQEENACFIKIENAEEGYTKAHASLNKTSDNNDAKRFELTDIDDILMSEVLIDQVINELHHLKDSIEIFKGNNSLFVDNSFRRNYTNKKNLVAKFIKCQDKADKDILKEELVSSFFNIFFKCGIFCCY